MALYYRAGWRFYFAAAIEYFLVIFGIIWQDNLMFFSGIGLGLLMIPWAVHISICDNKFGGK